MRLCFTLAKLRLNNWPLELAPSFPWAPAYSLYLTLPKTDIAVPKVSVLQRIDLFYRYGGHIELIRFKEYYGMPRGHEQDPIYSLSIYARLSGQFFFTFS